MNIRHEFESTVSELAELVLGLPFENRRWYLRFLSQQYYLVQNSTRYLALSASKVPVGQRHEFKHWVHHLSEELDHDLTILKDMMALGKDHPDPILPQTRALIASQYYDIETYGANALLGYALLLEGLSCEVCCVLASRVEAAFGTGSGYLSLHGHVDLEHFPEGLTYVEKLSLDQQQVVVSNLKMMAALYRSLLAEVCSLHEREEMQQNLGLNNHPDAEWGL